MASDVVLSEQTIPRTRVERESVGEDSSWLVWKEFRQLFPLFAMLSLVALLVAGILLIQSLLGSARSSSSIPIALIVFPAIFATGAGPLLVGQERVSRTLDWLNLLPVGTGRIFGIKSCVALAGLLVMWLLQFLLLQIFGHGELITEGWWVGGSASLIPIGYAALFIHSLFVLQAGFYVAWRMENQFHSLIALLPLIAFPILAVNLLQAADIVSLGEGGVLAFSAAGWLLLLPLSYSAAMRTLGPQSAPRVSGLPKNRWFRGAVAKSKAPSFESTASALIWQTFVSTRLTWTMLLAMLMLAFVGCAAASTMHVRDLAGPLLVVMTFGTATPALLAVTWLGVMVFKYDGSVAQVQFLSQRGVSPWRVLACRHAVPFALLCGCGCIYGLWQWLAVPSESDRVSLIDRHPVPSLTLLLSVGLVLYSAGQWVSQLVRTLILAVVLAPIAGGLLLGWFGFAWFGLGTPVWLLAVCSLIPLIVSAMLQGRYCDGHERPWGYLLGLFAILTIFTIPIADAVNQVSQVARMDEATRTRLVEEGRKAAGNAPVEVQSPLLDAQYRVYIDRLATRDTTAPVEFTERTLSVYESDASQWLRTLANVQDGESFLLRNDQIDDWYQRTQLARIRCEDESDEVMMTKYFEYLQWGSRLLEPARRSHRIWSQDAADYLEALLVELLQQQPADRHHDRPELKEAIGNLGTPQSRAQARRTAVLASFYRERERSFGWYDLTPAIVNTRPEGLYYWLAPRYREQWLVAMLEGIEASKKPQHSVSWCHDLLRLRSANEQYQGSLFQFIQDNGDVTLIPAPTVEFGVLWGGRWEYVDFGRGESDVE